MHAPKEIVLIPCAYTDDISVVKLRPVIILSSKEHNEKEKSIFGVVLTSNPRWQKRASPYLIEIRSENVINNRLSKQSFVLADVPFSTYTNEIKGTFGTVTDEFYNHILSKFKECIQE